MKKILIVAVTIVFSYVEKAKGQSVTVSSGIYLSANDFLNKTLIEEEECKRDHEDFKTHDFFQRQSFEVIYKGVRKTYLKSSIYAYRDCNNRIWRFFNNKEYELLEVKDIYIYKVSKVVMNGLTIEKDPIYFFSNGTKGDIKELTVENLKLIFPSNKEFIKKIDEEFKTDETDKAIHAYDFKNKMYRVNYLFEQSEK